MNFKIENEYLCIDISDIGAEMQSIFNKKNDTQYLWDGNPEYWDGHAYNLFPFCGRLWDFKYTYRGKEYKMDLHGFARNSIFTVKSKSKETISFELCSNEETYEIYPFEFGLIITYSLDKNKIYNYFTVLNNSGEVMYFSLGTHPGFFVPLQEDERFEHYFIEFPEKQTGIEKLRISKSGYLLQGTDTVVLENDRVLPLTREMFEGSNFFVNMSKSVALRSSTSDKAVVLTYPHMKYLGLWQVNRADTPYLCIEAWQGSPSYEDKVDDIEAKRDIISLDADEKWDTYITIEIR